jgi:hypothetical protein
VERKPGVARKQVEDTDTANMQQQEDMRSAEGGGLHLRRYWMLSETV